LSQLIHRNYDFESPLIIDEDWKEWNCMKPYMTLSPTYFGASKYQATVNKPSKRRLLNKLFIPAVMASTILGGAINATPANAQSPANQAVTTHGITTDSGKVNSALDIRNVTAANLGTQQKVVDMIPPLLSAQSTQRLNNMLNRFMESGVGEEAETTFCGNHYGRCRRRCFGV